MGRSAIRIGDISLLLLGPVVLQVCGLSFPSSWQAHSDRVLYLFYRLRFTPRREHTSGITHVEQCGLVGVQVT